MSIVLYCSAFSLKRSCFLAVSIVLYSAFLFNRSCFLAVSIVFYCSAFLFSISCFLAVSIVLYFNFVSSLAHVYLSYPSLVSFLRIFFSLMVPLLHSLVSLCDFS